jgi:hypothetical protein
MVRGITTYICYGFNTFIGEIPVCGFLIHTSPINETTRISLTSFLDSMTYSRSYGNNGNVLFFHSIVFSFSYAFEFVGIGALCFTSAA